MASISHRRPMLVPKKSSPRIRVKRTDPGVVSNHGNGDVSRAGRPLRIGFRNSELHRAENLKGDARDTMSSTPTQMARPGCSS